MINLTSYGHCVEHLSDFTAYIKDGEDGVCYVSDPSDWDVAVKSVNETGCEFIKVDKCIYGDGDESHCDCAFKTETELYFVEIKQSIAFDDGEAHAKRSKIRKDARNQLAETINLFKKDFSLNDLRNVHAVIATKPAVSDQTIVPISTRNQAAIAVFEAKCGCVNIYEGNLIEIR